MTQSPHGPEESTPPPRPGPVTDEQHLAIEAVIGVDAEPDLVRALRDALGRTFQRLEFFGDPCLEVIENLVAVTNGESDHEQTTTTDQGLTAAATALGVKTWLEWQPSPQRMADLVEATAGAAFLTAGWPQVAHVYATAFGPVPARIRPLVNAPVSEAPPYLDADPEPGYPALGASLLETAASLRVYSDFPEGSEGELSLQRGLFHRVVRIATWGRSQGVDPRWADQLASKRVEGWLARIALSHGVPTAFVAAGRVLA